MLRFPTLFAILISFLFVFPSYAAQVDTPVGAVLNGDFEAVPVGGVVRNALEGGPLDRCLGVGHQAFYGSETPQEKALGDPTDPEDDDPEGAAGQVADDPDGEAREFAGLDHCVSNGRDGSDVLWVKPVVQSRKAAGWSQCLEPSSEFGYGLDGDHSDREVRMIADPSLCSHNLWQSIVTPGQAHSLNFETLSFNVESGVIDSPSANIQLGFSLTPSHAQHPYAGVFWEGAVVFAGADLFNRSGPIALTPDIAEIRCTPNWSPCESFKTAFDAAENDTARADVLGQARLIQFSFWNFNRGTSDIVIDDIALDATTAAEELARGNVSPAPTV